jgi:hypothetical protein
MRTYTPQVRDQDGATMKEIRTGTKQLHVNLHERVYKDLGKIAEERGTTITNLVRGYIERDVTLDKIILKGEEDVMLHLRNKKTGKIRGLPLF